MSDLLTEERERTEALLGLTGLQFRDGPPDVSPAQYGALGGWRFVTPDGSAEAVVYVLDSADGVQKALERLQRAVGPANAYGLPAVSNNGGLVFAVRSHAAQTDTEATYRALGIASALGGEEE